MIYRLFPNAFLQFALYAVVLSGSLGQAQVTGANGPISWEGYVEAFNNVGGTKGTPVFGSPWGVAALKTEVSGALNNNLTLFPNYNAYNASDPFWANGTNGNKWMEASTIATNGLVKLDLTKPIVFAGTIISNNLASSHTAKAFIKIFYDQINWGNNYHGGVIQPLTNGTFSVSTNLPPSMATNTNAFIQYGFTVEGLNANPANSNSLGKVSLSITSVPSGFDGPQLAVKIAGLASSNNATNQLPAPIVGKSQTYLIQLENIGNSNLVITNFVLSNTVANSFLLGNTPTNATIAPSASLTIPLTSAPTSPAALAGVLTINSNDNEAADRNFRINLSAAPLQPIEEFTNDATGLLGWSKFAGTPSSDPSTNLLANSFLSLSNGALKLNVNSSGSDPTAPYWSGIQREVVSPGTLDLSNSVFRISLRSQGGATSPLNNWTSSNKNKVEVRLESMDASGGAATGSLRLGIPIDDTGTGTNIVSGQPDGKYDRVAIELTNDSLNYVTAGGNLSVLLANTNGSNSLARAINGSITGSSVTNSISPTAPLNLSAPFFRVVLMITEGEFEWDTNNVVEIDSIELQLATASKFELANGSFETDSPTGTNARSYIPNGWRQWARTDVITNNGVNKEISSQYARTGTKSLRLAPQGDKDTNNVWDGSWGSQKGVVYQEWPLPSPALSLYEGASVYAQASVKVLSLDRLTGGSALNFGFRYLTANNEIVRDDLATVNTNNMVLDQWVVLTANSTIPANAAKIQLVAEFVQTAASDAGSVFIDDLTVSQGSIITPIAPAGYSLVWADEFGGSSLNSGNWVAETGAGGWGNGEAQEYTTNNANLRVENGSLILQAVKSGSAWSSARIKTQGLRSFKYGKIEFRAKLPSGIGAWPAAWMMGTNISGIGWPSCGEIDVMEWRGGFNGVANGEANTVGHALHSASRNGGNPVQPGTRSSVTNPSTEFHTYAVLWNSNNMVFSVDGVDKVTLTPPVGDADAFRQEFFLLLNLAMGGNYVGGVIDSSLTSATYEVDYVRVYQDISAASTPADTTAPVITIAGANPASVNWGVTYSDAGATAFDAGDAANVAVTTNNPVNTAVPGSYLVTYTATDSKSNSASTNRTVNVALANSGTNRGADGLTDILRYAYGGTNTNALSTSLLPSNNVVGTNLVLTFYARTNANVTLTPVVTTNLANSNSWTNTGITVTTLTNVSTNGTILQKRQASTPVTGTNKFLRLKATYTP